MKKKKMNKNNPTISKLQEHVEHIKKTVYEGNGKPSILSQLTSLDHRMKSLETNLDDKINNLEKEMELKFSHITEVVTEKFNNISQQIAREFENKNESNKHSWNFKTAITTAVLASGTSIFVVLLSELLKR